MNARAAAQYLSISFAIGVTALMAGGCSTMKPGNVAAVEPVTVSLRVGNVFLFRGIVGIFSTGLDQLGDQINAAGVHADVFQDDQWSQLADMLVERYQRRPDAEPLVMIGHSWGADHILNIAERLNAAHIRVTLILTLDPVTPPAVPSNVQHCENLYQTNGLLDALPLFRGVPLKSASNSTALVNVNLHDESLKTDRPQLYQPGVNHFSIEKQQAVHTEIITQILAVCPLRSNWYEQQHPKAGLLAATPSTPVTPTTPATPTTQPVKSVASAG